MQALVYFGVEISIAWATLVAWVLQLQLPGPLVPHIYALYYILIFFILSYN